MRQSEGIAPAGPREHSASSKRQNDEERNARLAQISRQRKEANELAIRQAMQKLEEQRKPVTVAAVAREAGVSRQTVYNSPHAAEVQKLSRKTMHLKQRPAVQTLASEASLQRRLEDQADEIRRLRNQLAEANDKVQRLLQEQAQ